ncbi:hypothetical protein AWM70_06005 [Paenibacillus yonginensis]|uniref:Uncharacterized protein n=1 Tax=Paenibacillus yonginensis TaxID=1462996 RepID=A0A1B1MYG7_9BACL|nr:hypothetical protein [Paenibacillus yonginensis]ANS74189.1 hypothetical protein AWM70_06005 [Paenibacillus yonginensis]
MQLIQPLNKEGCKPYIGQHVCAVLHDGTQIHGVISNVTDKGIEFNGAARSAEVLSKNPQKAKKQLQQAHQKSKVKTRSKGKVSAYGPGPYGAPYGALDRLH